MESKVTQVIGTATKKDGSELRGIGKNGKPWEMMSVILENGTKMNVFAPVESGDIVENLAQDPQYHNWTGKVRKAGGFRDASQPTLATILNEILEIKKLLSGKEMTQEKFNEVILDDISDEPVSLDGIPF
jgi:hypothetical protein